MESLVLSKGSYQVKRSENVGQCDFYVVWARFSIGVAVVGVL